MKAIFICLVIFHLGICQEAQEPFQAPDKCHREPDPGECGEYNVRWFYNPKVGKCLRFLYRGCKGNQNNFEEEEICNTVCKGLVKTERTEKNNGEDETAAEIPSAGMEDPIERTEMEEKVKANMETKSDEMKTNTDQINDEGDDNDEEEDDGSEDDVIINKYIKVEQKMDPNDEEMLKEAMSQFEVSAFDAQEDGDQETMADIDVNKQESHDDANAPDHSESTEDDVSNKSVDDTTDKGDSEEESHSEDDKDDDEDDKDDDEDEDDDEDDDGSEDDEIIHKYLDTGAGLEPEDEEMLKEVMSQFEVSSLQSKEVEVDEDELADQDIPKPGSSVGTEDEPKQVPSGNVEVNTNTEETNEPEKDKSDIEKISETKIDADVTDKNDEELEDKQKEEDEEEEDEDDDGTEDDELIRKFLHTSAGIEPEDDEMLREIMSQFEVSTLLTKEVEVPETDGKEDEAHTETEETVSENDETDHNETPEVTEEKNLEMKSVETPPTANTAKSESEEEQDGDDDEDGFSENNGEKVDAFLDKLGDAIDVDDKETILEAISEFGALSLEAIDDVSDALPQETENEETPHLDSPHEPETESKSTNEKSDEDTASDKMKDATKEEEDKSGFVDTQDAFTGEKDDEDEGPVDNVSILEKDGIFNAAGIQTEDRHLLNELVSQYDVSVMQGKEKKIEYTNKDESDDSHFGKSSSAYDPSENKIDDKKDGLLSPRCTLPAETGACRARKLRWYFDMETGDCRIFTYGGCQGNANRFRSRNKCLKSCRVEGTFQSRFGIFRKPERLDTKKDRFPSPSFTKRITVMLPFRMFGKDQAAKENPVELPPRVAISPNIKPMEGVNPPPFRLPGQSGMPKIHFPPMNMPQEGNRNILPLPGRETDAVPPFAPLPFMLLRALMKPQQKEFLNRNPVSAPAPTPPSPQQFNLRLPQIPPNSHLPTVQQQQPVTPLQRPPLRPLQDMNNPRLRDIPDDRRPPFAPEPFSSDQSHTIFAPSMTKKARVKSSKHDNRHFNNITPNNKFTLLQVFVNKPHGPQQEQGMNPARQMDPMTKNQHPINPPFQPKEQRAPEHKSAPAPVPFSAPFVHHPMMYHAHPSWHDHMMRPHPSPFHHPFFPNYHPFDAPPYHKQDPRPPFRRPEHRRKPKFERPLVVVTDEDDEEDESDDHYSCLLSVAPGKCKAFQTKWYYNRETEKCQIFYFTGCGGNANNFETWEECAATCLDLPRGPRTTMPGKETEAPPSNSQDSENDQSDEEGPETIVFTSTVFPETEEEAKQAQKESESGDAVEPPSVEQLKTTTEAQVVHEQNVKLETEDVVGEPVSKYPSTRSTEYIVLMAVVGVIGLAVILLVSVSIAHLYRKMNTSKKEKVLEAVLNHHLYGDLPKLVHAGVSPPPPSANGTPPKA